jgi:hypothetical protein
MRPGGKLAAWATTAVQADAGSCACAAPPAMNIAGNARIVE